MSPRRNALEQFSYSLKSQVGDQEGLGGKLGADDKKSILDAVKSAQEWLETEGQTASAEEIDERREELQVRFQLTSYCSVQQLTGIPCRAGRRLAHHVQALLAGRRCRIGRPAARPRRALSAHRQQ